MADANRIVQVSNLRWWKSDTYTYANANSYSNSDTNTNAYSNTDTDTDTNANSDAGAAAERSEQSKRNADFYDSNQLVVDRQLKQ